MTLAALPMRRAVRAPQRQALLVTGADGQFVAIEEVGEGLEARAKRLFRGQRVALVALTVLEGIS